MVGSTPTTGPSSHLNLMSSTATHPPNRSLTKRGSSVMTPVPNTSLGMGLQGIPTDIPMANAKRQKKTHVPNMQQQLQLSSHTQQLQATGVHHQQAGGMTTPSSSVKMFGSNMQSQDEGFGRADFPVAATALGLPAMTDMNTGGSSVTGSFGDVMGGGSDGNNLNLTGGSGGGVHLKQPSYSNSLQTSSSLQLPAQRGQQGSLFAQNMQVPLFPPQPQQKQHSQPPQQQQQQLSQQQQLMRQNVQFASMMRNDDIKTSGKKMVSGLEDDGTRIGLNAANNAPGRSTDGRTASSSNRVPLNFQMDARQQQTVGQIAPHHHQQQTVGQITSPPPPPTPSTLPATPSHLLTQFPVYQQQQQQLPLAATPSPAMARPADRTALMPPSKKQKTIPPTSSPLVVGLPTVGMKGSGGGAHRSKQPHPATEQSMLLQVAQKEKKQKQKKPEPTLHELQRMKDQIAKKLDDAQKSSGQLLDRSAEPSRNKTHWDYVCMEVEWMAKDFTQERKWRVSQSKKYAKACVTHLKKSESQKIQKIKAAEKQIKKLASKIGKIVINDFWKKVMQIRDLEAQASQDEKRKKKLQDRLDTWVDFSKKVNLDLARTLTSTKKKDKRKKDDPDYVPDEEPSVLSQSSTSSSVTQVHPAKASIARDEDNVREQKDELNALTSEANASLESILPAGYVPVDEMSDSDNENSESQHSSSSVASRTSKVPGSKESNGVVPKDKSKVKEASELMKSAAPLGTQYENCPVKTEIPHLLRFGTLREYQHIGLDWLVSLHKNDMNGILADEMGLGKTIQTIALLAWLACNEQNWGQHLIIVPTSVLINWEMEFKRWLPGFKILTYYGSAKERKLKRKGWSKYHVVISSYNTVVQDHTTFRRRKWEYMILDEAQHIKNFQSKKWQILLNFNTTHRLLLTGTPLQNNLMELWSLMHFLMPAVFQSQIEFREWFNNPVTGMIEQNRELANSDLISRLHTVLRPFLLRRLKREVAKQLPKKYEHVLPCRLSLRQRRLYEDFMNEAETQQVLMSGNFMGMMNILMQLRKVCNHPDLFTERPIVSSFDTKPIEYKGSSAVFRALEKKPFETVALEFLNFILTQNEDSSTWNLEAIKRLQTQYDTIVERARRDLIRAKQSSAEEKSYFSAPPTPPSPVNGDTDNLGQLRRDIAQHLAYVNKQRCAHDATYGSNLIKLVTVEQPARDIHLTARKTRYLPEISSKLMDLVKLPETRALEMKEIIENFVCLAPSSRAPPTTAHCPHPDPSQKIHQAQDNELVLRELSKPTEPFHSSFVRTQIYFPDKRLIQWDCGKLQKLDQLLRRLKNEGHRALIFTQMTKMLDILESFLNVYSYRYLRLDGSTKVDDRAIMMEKFNTDSSYFIFILSTRSGGLGINLTGADTVIFYDTDWNPAMDLQAQDRCHRIGQTREVNIYRLVTQNTVEENILNKANQKKKLNATVIGDGGFTVDFFQAMDPRELLGIEIPDDERDLQRPKSNRELAVAMAQAEDVRDRQAAAKLKDETDADLAEFTEVIPEENQMTFQEKLRAGLKDLMRYAYNFLGERGTVVYENERPMAGGQQASYNFPISEQHQRDSGGFMTPSPVVRGNKKGKANRSRSRAAPRSSTRKRKKKLY